MDRHKYNKWLTYQLTCLGETRAYINTQISHTCTRTRTATYTQAHTQWARRGILSDGLQSIMSVIVLYMNDAISYVTASL